MPPSPIDLAAEKAALRRELLALRRSFSPWERERWNDDLCQAVGASDAFALCELLLCYCPVRGEADPLPLARLALRLGKRVAFPVSHVEDCTLSFHAVGSLDELTTGAYGIPEPPVSSAPITDFSQALCLVPALSFDRDGYRLGYGKGYYDRFLSRFDGVSVGVVYSPCLRDRLPRNGTDLAVDRIFTEKGELLPHEA